MDQSEIAQVARWVHNAERAVAFTGAGISTESGIPDFRSPGGIWTTAPAMGDKLIERLQANAGLSFTEL